jgi:hypothetical protein
MAVLVPIASSAIKATYLAADGYLELTAKGSLSSIYLAPSFERENWAGGLRYSLRSYVGGLGKPAQKPFDITEKLRISLPAAHFNNTSVIVETSLGTFKIPISYKDFVGPVPVETGNRNGNPATDDEEYGSIYGNVLPPIELTITGGRTLVISAKIPKLKDSEVITINPSFNRKYLEVVTSGYKDGFITWTIEWTDVLPGPGENPQLFNVTTTIWNGLLGPLSGTTRVEQGYLIEYVVLQAGGSRA